MDRGWELRQPMERSAGGAFPMTEPKRYLLLVLALVAGLSIIGCGGGSSSPPIVPADFTMSVQPGSVTVTQGSSSTPAMIAVSPLHSFNGSVSVSISGLPSGVTTSPAVPFTITAGASQSVTFSAANSATLGPVNLTFSGASGNLSHTAGATMSVNPATDFGINIEPGQLSVTQGAVSTPAAVSVTPLNSFSGTVSIDIKGLPAGVATSQALPLQVSAGSKQQITFTAANSVAPGTMNVVFQGSSGSLSHNASAALQIQAASIPDFRLGLDNNAVALKPGTSQAVKLSVAAMNQFADSVTVAISGLPKGVTVSPASPFSVAANASKAVTFSAAVGAGVGNSVVTLTGSDGALNHAQAATVQVLANAVSPTFSVAYFDSSIVPVGILGPDQSIKIVNPGVQSTASVLGDLCANIYVFDSSQELKECCSCPVTANGYIRLSVNTNLTSNPGNGVPFNIGSVAVVPSVLSAATLCDATSVSPIPSLDIWTTHIANRGAGFRLVETLAPSTPLSGPELTELQSVCGFIVANQSGAGICSCSVD
jgi:hypothetical protein